MIEFLIYAPTYFEGTCLSLCGHFREFDIRICAAALCPNTEHTDSQEMNHRASLNARFGLCKVVSVSCRVCRTNCMRLECTDNMTSVVSVAMSH